MLQPCRISTSVRGALLCGAWVGSLIVAGCGPAPKKELTNPDPSGKIPAIKATVRAKDVKSTPQLIKELESDDPAVRFYAIEALRRLTGQDFGFRYFDDENRREPAVNQWKEWQAKQK